jgi:hypothetical protein
LPGWFFDLEGNVKQIDSRRRLLLNEVRRMQEMQCSEITDLTLRENFDSFFLFKVDKTVVAGKL